MSTPPTAYALYLDPSSVAPFHKVVPAVGVTLDLDVSYIHFALTPGVPGAKLCSSSHVGRAIGE